MAAQDAELKLKVSLDLAFFRQQLTGLGQAAAGTPLKLQVQFDRRSVQNELNALGANIRRRNYYLEVKTNLEAEIKKAKQLADALNALPKGGGAQSAAGIVGKGFSQATLKGLGDDIKTLYKALGDAGLIEFNKSIANNKAKIARELSNIGQDTIAGLLNGINSDNAKVAAAAQSLGISLLASLKRVLKIQSPSREMFDIGDDAGKGFELGLLKALDIAERSTTRKMRGMLDRLARMALMMSGMSAADIGSQAGQFRGGRSLPGPSWAATVPPSQRGGGGGGRMLPPGPTFAALGGTAFSAQKYLPTALSDELKQILRGAAFAFVDSLKQQTRSVRVGLGASQQPLLAGGRIAGLLPAGVGRQASVYSTGKIGGETQAELFARREREARMRSALRGIDVMGAANREPSPYSYAYRSARPTSAIVPYAAGGALVPGGGAGGGGAGGRGGGRGPGGFDMGGFGRALGSVNLPGANTVRELGAEFAFATKQVLLFGQAYKLLGFAQDLPSQVGNAVGQLQSFRNTLSSITGSAGEAAQANQFILETVDKYNIPLQSARDGFTKLFASMAPAGFSAGEIQDLFLGISKAAATFGMSADKVDRVNYAFAQMASKGQVMSEELKGQLGDVLPGAMGIFAEAAGFKGPDAIQKFGKALEDGAYKGQAMRDLLKNVTIVMNKEFGPGAEGAARTFQGVINRMQNSTKLLYESFEPVAVGFLNSVVAPMTRGIKEIADGLNAFFTKTNAKTAGGFALAQELERMKPAFDGIRQNISNLLPVFTQLANVALNVGKVFLEIAGNPFIGYLLRVYASVFPLTLAIQALNLQALIPLLATLLRTVPAFVGMAIAALRGTTSLQTLNAAIVTTGISLRTVFASTGVGLILVGLGLLIERFITMGAKLDEIKAKAAGASLAIRAMSKTEARQEEINRVRVVRGLRSLQGQGGGRNIILDENFANMLEGAGIPLPRTMGGLGQRYIEPTRIPGYIQQQQQLQGEARYRQVQLTLEERQLREQTMLPPITGAGDGENGNNKRQRYVSQLAKILQQELQNKLSFIDQDASLSDREREISKAAVSYKDELLIAEAEYSEKISEEKTKNISNLSEYLKESKRLYDLEKAQIQSRYEGIVTKPLREMLGQDRQAQIELQESVTSLASGKDELTQVEKRQYQIKQALLGLDQDQVKALKPLIDLVLSEAKKVDVLTEAQKRANKAKEERNRLDEQIKTTINNLKDEIAILRAISGEERKRLKIRQENQGISKEKENQIYELEKTRDNIKAVRELIDNFVTDTSRDYKGFLKAVISGEDAADALKQFQEGLSDRVLTIFLDFSMKPVEDFFKDVMGGEIINKLFPQDKLKEGELLKATSTDPTKAANDNTNATNANTTAINNLTNALTTQATQAAAPFSNGMFGGGFGVDTTGMGNGFSQFLGAQGGFMAGGGSSLAGVSEQLNNISYSAGAATPQLIGLTTSLSEFSLSTSQTAIDTGKAAADTAKNSADFTAGLGKAVQGIGIAVSSIMTIAAGIQQIGKGGTKNTLAGIGSILMGLGGGIGGFLRLGKAANGAVWKGGFQAFANGGTVQGPTLGLIGEGKYNEAIVPLPDGRSIPVQMNEPPRSREIMGGGSANAAPTLNMSFQTTTINGVEYVSREQLEQAMLETRRLSVKEGSAKGASLALDKLQQSPSARRRVGI